MPTHPPFHRRRRRQARTALALAALILLAACGGWRKGWYSQPYLDGSEPAQAHAKSPFLRDQSLRLQLPELALQVDLRNDVQTSDTAWIVPVPVHVELRDRWAYRDGDDAFCLRLQLEARRDGLRFDPHAVTVTVDALVHHVEDAVPTEPQPLAPGRPVVYSLCFDAPRPSPLQTIALDLSQALPLPEGRPLPTIRFRATRWTAPYS